MKREHIYHTNVRLRDRVNRNSANFTIRQTWRRRKCWKAVISTLSTLQSVHAMKGRAMRAIISRNATHFFPCVTIHVLEGGRLLNDFIDKIELHSRQVQGARRCGKTVHLLMVQKSRTSKHNQVAFRRAVTCSQSFFHCLRNTTRCTC